MIAGVIVQELVRNVDERGFLSELLRSDWKSLLGEDKIAQLNLSCSYPNIVRAWHRHPKGQVDYFICIEGAIKLCAYDDRKGSPTQGELDEIILSEERMRIARIPGILWHGYRSLGPKPIKLVYAVNHTYDPENPDEERLTWNDPNIVPRTVNGNRSDLRIGRSWDWFAPPHH
jgi:dTDP-4-dehydrorhamnose 3,5-epimerase